MTDTFTTRCKLATDSLPMSEYRDRLEALHAEMLRRIEAAEQARIVAQTSLERYKGACLVAETRAEQADAKIAAVTRERDELLAYIANHPKGE